MSALSVTITKLAHGADLPLPSYATDHSAGMDLLAAVAQEKVLAPGERALIPTGIAIALPPGYEAQIRPRSGLAAKNGVTVLNSPGTIDADYSGEVGVVLINHGRDAFTVSRGMRIAQMVVARHEVVSWRESGQLPQSGRGAGGFGSTGLDPNAARSTP